MNKRKLLSQALICTLVLGFGTSTQAKAIEVEDFISESTSFATEAKLNISVIEAITLADVTEIAEQLKELLNENPTMTETAADAFVISYLNKKYGEISSYEYLPDNGLLNSAEKDLFAQSPSKGVLALSCAQDAKSRSERVYQSNTLYLGNGDAFRHALWNGYMVREIGSTYAKKWGDAHEHTSSGVDKQMDLNNNASGRSIANSVTRPLSSPYWKGEFEELLIKAIDNGELDRVVNGRLVSTNSTGRK